MSAKKKQLTYEDAYTELEGILLRLQEEEVNMEELPKLIQRAKELTEYCRGKLREVEEKVADEEARSE
ncbi:MAG TPA: exodeoxyribonuclease VII small subunit [Phaeodactylibacter sp.]|nr:exodeoxyribonuclease VII small subunit [Phaeodactylibacter sp.]